MISGRRERKYFYSSALNKTQEHCLLKCTAARATSRVQLAYSGILSQNHVTDLLN